MRFPVSVSSSFIFRSETFILFLRDSSGHERNMLKIGFYAHVGSAICAYLRWLWTNLEKNFPSPKSYIYIYIYIYIRQAHSNITVRKKNATVFKHYFVNCQRNVYHFIYHKLSCWRFLKTQWIYHSTNKKSSCWRSLPTTQKLQCTDHRFSCWCI